MLKQIEVAVGVVRRSDGRFLLGQRAPGSFYPGYWELPGGKVEAGESPVEALARELREELGITVEESWPWLVREHHYEHARVRLHFFEVPYWHGTVRNHVHCDLNWVSADGEILQPMLPANGPVFKSLGLPGFIGITQASVIGVSLQLRLIEKALASGLRAVQIREPTMSERALGDFVAEVQARARPHGALVLVNTDPALALRLEVGGVHLNSEALMQCAGRPALEWVGASCHDRRQLEQAVRIGADFALLGPVQQTRSHPGASGIGWSRFSELTAGLPLPVLALGGLSMADWRSARRAGAHGVAAITGAWQGFASHTQ